jgi:hypothetical protein
MELTPNQELLTYIKARKESGGTNVEITGELVGAGWGQNDVELALKSFETSVIPVKKEPEIAPVSETQSGHIGGNDPIVFTEPIKTVEASHPADSSVSKPVESVSTLPSQEQPTKTVKTSHAALVLILITVGVAAVGFGLWWYLSNRAPVEQKVEDVATTTSATNVSTTTSAVVNNTATSSNEVNSNMVHIKGTVVVPKGIFLEKIQIVSLGKTSSVGKDGSFETDVNKDGVSSVSAMLPDKGFGLMNVVIGDDAKNVVKITTQTTAEAIVFSSPYLMTTTLTDAKEFMSVIKKDPAVAKFATVIEQTIAKTGDPYKDALFMAAYEKAVDSVLTALES